MPSSGDLPTQTSNPSPLSPALVGGFFTTSTTWEKPSSPEPEWLKLPTVQGPTWIWSFQPEGGAVTPPRLHQLLGGVGSRGDWAPAALAAARWAPAGSRRARPPKQTQPGLHASCRKAKGPCQACSYLSLRTASRASLSPSPAGRGSASSASRAFPWYPGWRSLLIATLSGTLSACSGKQTVV